MDICGTGEETARAKALRQHSVHTFGRNIGEDTVVQSGEKQEKQQVKCRNLIT